MSLNPTQLVTGGAGFIGSNYVAWVLSRTDDRVVVLDKLTYAGNLANLDRFRQHSGFRFVQGDIADRTLVARLLEEERPQAVLNFAAETHVDRSIDDPSAFVETNVVGVFHLLEACRSWWNRLPQNEQKQFRFLQVSTDEVYGSLGSSGLFTEETPVAPNSPYSASKSAADHFVRAWFHTYGLPVLITNCSNNYGPFQFPEKLVPLMTLNALEGKPLPIYGDGGNVRDWLYVEDHCAGILEVLRRGRVGERYNLGGNCEKRNVEIVDQICNVLEELRPAAQNPALEAAGVRRYVDLKTFVPDRPGHDRRYAIDCSKIRRELGWEPAHSLESGLRATVAWYLENLSWCDAVQSRGYRRERLGLEGAKP
jgi:dTDP-glucose 4,6-dehydratase